MTGRAISKGFVHPWGINKGRKKKRATRLDACLYARGGSGKVREQKKKGGLENQKFKKTVRVNKRKEKLGPEKIKNGGSGQLIRRKRGLEKWYSRAQASVPKRGGRDRGGKRKCRSVSETCPEQWIRGEWGRGTKIEGWKGGG